MKNFFIVLAFASSLFATGCGGGSTSGAAPIDPTMTVPFQAAVANFALNGANQNFTISGWVDNSPLTNPGQQTPLTGNGNLARGTPSPATFNGIPALEATEVVAGSTTENGQTTPFSSTEIIYYSPGNYTTVGTVSGGETMLISPYTLPVAVKAGDTGLLGSGTQGGTLPTTSTESYAVTSDSATSLLVTLTQNTDAGISGSTTTQTAYRVTTSANISLVSITTQYKSVGIVYKLLTFTF